MVKRRCCKGMVIPHMSDAREESGRRGDKY